MRDKKGRFTKTVEEGLNIIIHIPSFKRIVYLVFLLAILMPWISIICRFELLKKILEKFDCLMIKPSNEEQEGSKKGGLFY